MARTAVAAGAGIVAPWMVDEQLLSRHRDLVPAPLHGRRVAVLFVGRRRAVGRQHHGDLSRGRRHHEQQEHSAVPRRAARARRDADRGTHAADCRPANGRSKRPQAPSDADRSAQNSARSRDELARKQKEVARYERVESRRPRLPAHHRVHDARLGLPRFCSSGTLLKSMFRIAGHVLHGPASATW